MKFHGELTGQIGDRLALDFPNYDVYHDHGKAAANIGKIVSWFGKDLHKDTELSQLDIAIVERDAEKRVRVLIEIEETNDKPKTVLGDVFGALFGEHISFRGASLNVGDWTTLIVMVKGSDNHKERIEFLNRTVQAYRSGLPKMDGSIGKILIAAFIDESDLEPKLREQIELALGAHSRAGLS